MFRTLNILTKCSFSQAKTLYEVMGIPSTATKDEIKNQFHLLAKKYHPDSQSFQKGSTELFKEVSQAYSILSDETKRQSYDNQNLRKPNPTQYSQEAQQNNTYQEPYHQQQNYNPPRGGGFKYNKQKTMDQGDGLEEGFLNSMKRAPELYLVTFIMAVLTMKWWSSVYEQHGGSNKVSYPEDPEFIRERESEMAKREIKASKIYVQPHECKKIPLDVLDAMYESGRYNLPEKCLSELDKYRNEGGQQIEFDVPQQRRQSNNQRESRNQRDNNDQRESHNQRENNDEQGGQVKSFEGHRIDQIRNAMVFRNQNKDLNYITKENYNDLANQPRRNIDDDEE